MKTKGRRQSENISLGPNASWDEIIHGVYSDITGTPPSWYVKRTDERPQPEPEDTKGPFADMRRGMDKRFREGHEKKEEEHRQWKEMLRVEPRDKERFEQRQRKQRDVPGGPKKIRKPKWI